MPWPLWTPYWMPSGILDTMVLVLCSVVGSYIVISFGEHAIHKHLMHRKRLPKRFYEMFRPLRALVDDHVHLHHSAWYRNTDMAPGSYDPRNDIEIGPKESISMFITSSPLWGTLLWMTPPAGVIFMVTLLLHNRLWNPLHRTMHMPEGRWFTQWRPYLFLTRHHFMHHEKPNKNFNIFFPLADFILGTAAYPEKKHVFAMYRLGYYKTRKPGMRALIAKGLDAAQKHAYEGAVELDYRPPSADGRYGAKV